MSRTSRFPPSWTLRLLSALRLVWESAPAWTLARFLLTFIQGILPLFTIYLMKLVVDTAALSLRSADKSAEFGQVALYVVLYGAVSLSGAVVGALAGWIGEAQTKLVTDHVLDILHAKSVEVDLEYYETPQYFDTLHRAQQQAPHLPTQIINTLMWIVQSSISLLALGGLVIAFDWVVAALFIVGVVPGILVRIRYSRKTFRWQRERTPVERRAWYIQWLLTGDVTAKEVRLFGLGPLFVARSRELRRKLRRESLALSAQRSLASAAAQVLSTTMVFVCFGLIAYRTVQGTITLGDLVMYYQGFQRGQGFLQGILNGLADLYESNLFLSNLFEFLDLKSKIVEPRHPQPFPRPVRDAIVLDHVGFRYPTGARWVLEDITLTIRPGEHIALVGANGAGKTTLIKLLCRLYDPCAGSIYLDGTDLRQFESGALRREISVVFQDYVRYHLTARENIWLGNLDLSPEDERIQAAARCSGADSIIAGLPHGYSTTLGNWFEEGAELSLGEWQKVALARAFLRDAQILVLDEPTSSLDAQSEYEVFQQFRKLAAGRTAILISHRFSTVRLADFIYVLEGGRIVEGGTHEGLMRRGGTYARLFSVQASYYQ